MVATSSSPRVIYVVKQLELAIRARLDVICRTHGITTTQYTALSVLVVRPGMSSAQLAIRSFIKPQSAHQTVKELEHLGYLRREPDTQNRRVLRIALTDEGLELVASCDRDVDQLERQLFQGLTMDDAALLPELLNHCTKNLRQ